MSGWFRCGPTFCACCACSRLSWDMFEVAGRLEAAAVYFRPLQWLSDRLCDLADAVSCLGARVCR